MNRLEEKLDRILETQAEHGKILAVQSEILNSFKEKQVNMESELKVVEKNLVPLNNHVNGIKFLGKAIGGLSLLMSVAAGAAKFMGVF